MTFLQKFISRLLENVILIKIFIKLGIHIGKVTKTDEKALFIFSEDEQNILASSL